MVGATEHVKDVSVLQPRSKNALQTLRNFQGKEHNQRPRGQDTFKDPNKNIKPLLT